MVKRSITLKSRVEDLELLDESIDEIAEEGAWEDRLANQIRLVLEELIVNVINYAYDDQDDSLHDIEVDITSDDEQVVMELADDGKAFDPSKEAPSPDLASNVTSRPIGGLGIHLIFKLTDHVAYVRKAGMNRLTVTKRRPS